MDGLDQSKAHPLLIFHFGHTQAMNACETQEYLEEKSFVFELSVVLCDLDQILAKNILERGCG